jgi:hypothetical protein
MEQLSFFQFSEEEFQTIARLGAMNFSPQQICKFFQFNNVKTAEFIKEWRNKTSLIREHYDYGITKASYDINEKLHDSAVKGNVTSIQLFQKNTDERAIQNIKEKYFG